jgi:hypothetical protein
MNHPSVRTVEMTVEQKKEFLVSRGAFERCEFGFFDQLPDHIQHKYLDIALRVYAWRAARAEAVAARSTVTEVSGS